MIIPDCDASNFNTFVGCNKDRESSTPIYTVTFNSKGGSRVTVQTVQEGDTVEKPVDPTLQNYGFAGWTKAEMYPAYLKHLFTK